MSGILTIARYELTRRWALVVVGFALGLVPLFFFPIEGGSTQLSDALTVLGVVLSWTIAFGTGMTLVGRPLHDGRLSFYFTRPIADSSIAGGKLIGGCLAITGMQLALALPQIGQSSLLDQGGIRLCIGLAFIGNAFLAVGLVVGIYARSRTRWFLVDLAGGAIATTFTMLMLATLNYRKAYAAANLEYLDAREIFEHVDTMLRGLLVIAITCVLAAVVVAVARGRTDRERVHRMLSFTLWPALATTALVGFLVARWGFQ